MTPKKQKDLFLLSEGDLWFLRNQSTIEELDIKEDHLFKEIITVSPPQKNQTNLLEIGCGNGKRLMELKKNGLSGNWT